MDDNDQIKHLKEQCASAANIVVDALMMAGVIKNEDGDRAFEIVEEEIRVLKAMKKL